MSDASTGSGRDPVEQLIESFLNRLRRGERPSLADYAQRCPERVDEIRTLFATIVALEQLKPAVRPAPDAAHPPSPRPEPAPRRAQPFPERLGDYRILRVISEGGMGVVYEAEHESLSNRVALKVMHPRFRADGSYLRRFRQEACSAARLHHTNIVPVFDFGEQDGICYYAMQYICGVGLNDVLEGVRRLRGGFLGDRDDRPTEPAPPTLSFAAQGLLTGRFALAPAATLEADERTVDLAPRSPEPLAPPLESPPPASPPNSDAFPSSSFVGQSESIYFRELARLGAQVADALDYAHRQGVVHRDVKPSNLLLDTQGNIWLVDFGLAKLVEEDAHSHSRDMVGTLRFMPPERFQGISDTRGDIYGTGATLYEMLALRPAFDERDHVQLIDKITHQPPVPLRQHDRRIPRDLETIVLRALAKDPKDRFATAGELRDELRRFLEGRPLRSRPVGPAEQLWRWCKRNPWLAAANVTAALLTTLLAIGSTIAAWTYRHQLQQLDIEQNKTESNLNWALKAERKGRLDLGTSLQAEGAALQRTGLQGQRFDSLDRLSQAARVLREQPEGRTRLGALRDQAIAAMGLTDLRLVEERHIGAVMAAACDPTLTRYAITELVSKKDVGGDAIVRSWADDRELLRVPRADPGVWWSWPEFSPDGQYLLVYSLIRGSPNLVTVCHLESKQLRFRQRGIGDAVFHPDGRRLIFRPTSTELAAWDLVEGRETMRRPLAFEPVSLAIAPDGRRIALNAPGTARTVEIQDLETGHALAGWTGNVGKRSLSWSGDGRLLAMGNEDARVFVWDVERGSLVSVFHDRIGGLDHGAFSPVGHVYVTSWGGTTRLWDGSSGELLVTVPQGNHVRVAADGRRLMLRNDSEITVWEVAHDQELRTLNPGLIGNRTEGEVRGMVFAARFSPDGRLLAVATGEAVFLYDGRDCRALAQLATGQCETVLFDRAGRNLITDGARGLFRWPIRDDPDGGARALRIGPPVLLQESSSGSRYKAAWLPDGRTLAMVDHDHARVLLVDAESPHPARARPRVLTAPPRARLISIAVSPDGQWAAAGGWNDPGVYVWDLPRGRFERILPRGDSPVDGHTLPAFSPDGRWLVSSSTLGTASGHYFWETGSWKRGPFLPWREGWGEPVFSPDGALIALCPAANQVRLAESATGRPVAHLNVLQTLSSTPLAFSLDGTRLIAATNQHTALVWDLRRIRARLQTMDLDWDEPPFPARVTSADDLLPPIRSIRVLGAALEPNARRASDLAACDARLREDPGDADALLDRGWLALCMSSPLHAIPDLERSILLRPDDADALYLLASAQLQANSPVTARATLERYLAHAGEDADVRFLKGRVALQLGSIQEADDDFGEVLALDPNRNTARLTRAQIRLRIGRLEEALADFNVLVSRAPRDPYLLELRSQVHDRLGHREQALADWKRAVALPGASAETLNNIAWRLATGPAILRDPEQALTLAHKAVALTPGTATHLNTLGVAQYRAGQWAEAVVTLESSLAAGQGRSDAFDLFFLAMARYRLGQIAQARADFDRAVHWRRDHPDLPNPDWAEELDRFESEARDLLSGAAPELPDDVFAPRLPGRP